MTMQTLQVASKEMAFTQKIHSNIFEKVPDSAKMRDLDSNNDSLFWVSCLMHVSSPVISRTIYLPYTISRTRFGSCDFGTCDGREGGVEMGVK